MWVGIISPTVGLNWAKGRGGEPAVTAGLLELTHWSSLWTATHTTRSPASQVFRLRLNHTTGFPGSPTCRGQTVGCLSLHNCMSQFLIINLLMYTLLVLFLWRTLTYIMGKESVQSFLQSRYSNGQMAHEKIIICHQGNEYQNHNQMPFYPHKGG